MKLYYTTTSPFARKVRVAAIEAGIYDGIELVVTTVRDPESALLPLSPAGRVPVLRTADGVVLSEATYICSYLADVHGRKPLMPTGDKRWRALEIEGQACGLLDGVVTWVRALRAPEELRNPKAIALEDARVNRCLDAFDRRAGAWEGSHAVFHLPQITLGCALGALSFRLPDVDWRAGRPALSDWWDRISERPSMKQTAPFE